MNGLGRPLFLRQVVLTRQLFQQCILENLTGQRDHGSMEEIEMDDMNLSFAPYNCHHALVVDVYAFRRVQEVASSVELDDRKINDRG